MLEGLESDRAASAEKLEQTLARRAAAIGDLAADILRRCRKELAQKLASVRSAHSRGPELPQPRGRPNFHTTRLVALMLSDRPAFAPGARRLLLALARRRSNASASRAVAESLVIHSEA